MYTYMYKTRVCSTSSSTINDNILKHLTLVTYCCIFITSRDYTTSCDNTCYMYMYLIQLIRLNKRNICNA